MVIRAFSGATASSLTNGSTARASRLRPTVCGTGRSPSAGISSSSRRPMKNPQHDILIKRVASVCPAKPCILKNGALLINGERQEFPEGMPENQYYVSDMDLIRPMAANAESPDQGSGRLCGCGKPIPYAMACLIGRNNTQVPEGAYLLLGDNSLYSVDGRVWGWLPEEHLLGRVFAIWWPLGATLRFYRLLRHLVGQGADLRYPRHVYSS